MLSSRPAPRIRLIGLFGVVALLLASCSSNLGVPDPATRQAESIFDLWKLFFWAGVAVAGIMYVVMFWSALRYRKTKKSTRRASQFRENTPLEVFLVVLPLLIVIALMFPTYFVGSSVDDVSEDPDLTVNVTAFQWNWRFQYDGTEVDIIGTPNQIPTLVLPVGETVRIVLESVDVDHSFYVPAFLFKRDAIPGLTNVFDFNLEKAGTFHAQCAEFCGLDHARMLFDVEALPKGEFDTWLAKQEREAASTPPLRQDEDELERSPLDPTPTPEVTS